MALETTAMPWKESDKVTERMKFVARYLEGERITDLSREFGISRQTGHALVKRYELFGESGLVDVSSRPHRSPNKTPMAKVDEILRLRRKRPTWGPKKLKERLEKLQPEIVWPAASTIGAILADAGVVRGRNRRRRASPTPTRRRETQSPNELWCMDYKGQFRLGNRSYCYPLTVTDHFSRYLTCCDALENTQSIDAETSLLATFSQYGLPTAIRSDNGSPFASTGRLGLTRLSVWLMRLGIELERIEPGHPEQNGRHERMHLTLKQDTTRPAAHSMLAQQEKFDAFRAIYNGERPHEALGMKTPGERYEPSRRSLPKRLPPLTYPFHDLTCTVRQSGQFDLGQLRNISIGRAFVGQELGLRELSPGTWLVSFMELDLGYLDEHTKKVLPITHSKPSTQS